MRVSKVREWMSDGMLPAWTLHLTKKSILVQHRLKSSDIDQTLMIGRLARAADARIRKKAIRAIRAERLGQIEACLAI
jgi:hypothetical protein